MFFFCRAMQLCKGPHLKKLKFLQVKVVLELHWGMAISPGKGFLSWAGGRYAVCSRLTLIAPFSYRNNTLEYELRWRYASYVSWYRTPLRKRKVIRYSRALLFVCLLCICMYGQYVGTFGYSIAGHTPSVSNYKSFQESWRVKPSQSLTKIIGRNIKIYDIK